MRYKQILILFLLFLRGLESKSQVILIGPDNTIKNSETLTEILGEKNGILYLQKTQSDVFKSDGEYLERFNSQTLENLGSIPLLLNDAFIESNKKKLKPYLENLFFFQGRIYMFMSAYDRVTNRTNAYVGLFDERDFQYGIREIDHIKNTSSYDPGNFVFTPNDDGSKLIIWQNIPGAKKDKSLMGIKVFDKDLNQLWVKGFALPYNRNDVELKQIISNNSGDVAMLLKIYLPRKEIKPGNLPYRYHVVTYRHGDASVHDHQLILAQKRVEEVAILLNHNQEIVVSGFIGNEAMQGTSGAIYGTYNFTGDQVQKLVSTIFPPEILSQFLKEKNITRGDGLPGFSVDKVFLKSDGGIYVISEQYLIQEVCNRDARGILACNYYYYYNSIIVHSITKDGAFMWTKSIPKFQGSVNDNGWYSSYAVSFKKDSLYFVYNEHIKNFDQNDPDKFKSMIRPGKSVLALTVMDENGNIKKEALFNSKTGNNIVRPRFYNYDKDGNLVLPAHAPQSNKFKLIKIEF